MLEVSWIAIFFFSALKKMIKPAWNDGVMKSKMKYLTNQLNDNIFFSTLRKW